MKIIVVSDSHGKQGILEDIENTYPHADVFVHCGDIEEREDAYPRYLTVRGNNDLFNGEYPDEQIVQLGSHKALITHSHLYSYMRRMQQMAQKAKNAGCDLVFFGHTHVATDEMVDGVRLINPGSLWRSRDGRGPSYAIVEIDGATVRVEFIFLPQKKSKGYFW